MKKLVVICLLFLAIVNANSQIGYYDALYLGSKRNVNTGKIILTKDVQQLLLNYYPNKIEDQIDTALTNKNPFLKGIFAEQAIHFEGSEFKSLSLSTIGNLNITNFADGLAKFLVERSKEELNVAFFSKFQEFVLEYPEIKIIFPTTTDFLGEIYSYQYSSMLNAFRAAFQKDLNAFSSNLLNLRYIDSYGPVSNSDENIKRIKAITNFFTLPEGRAIAGALLVTDGIMKGNNAADIINTLANDEICQKNYKENFSNLVQLTDLISASIRSTDKERIWITKQQINDLVKDEITFKIYLGLLCASDLKRNHPIQFSFNDSVHSFQSILKKIGTSWNTVNTMEFKSGFISAASALSTAADNALLIKSVENENDKSSILIYADYASSVASIIQQSVHFLSSEFTGNEFTKITPEIIKFTEVVDNATSACYDIKSQNYSALILHVSSILSEFIPDYDSLIKKDFLKYGVFMANIVEAQNSDEVKAAIEAAVLPVGSSSIKRETDFNVSLNSFIGPYSGMEYMPALQSKPWAFSTGITAPAGIAFSWGNIGKVKSRCDDKIRGGKSISIFFPLIDIGSLASFRMSDNETEVASEITLSNIVSPGLYLYYGFGKVPVSVGVGGQLGPQLRKITTDNVDINQNYYVRFGLNVVVDIPLFNLYTKN